MIRRPGSPPTEEDAFMRLAAVIAATTVVLTLNACSQTEEAAPVLAETEAAEASGVAAMTAEEAAEAAAAAASAPYAGASPTTDAAPGPAPVPGDSPTPDAAVENTAETPAP
jgi:hypothetical protein